LPSTSDQPIVAPDIPMPPPVPEPLVTTPAAPPSKPEAPLNGQRPSVIERVRPDPAPEAAGNRVVPSVSIETVAPDHVPFGQSVSYEIVVKNVGSLPVSQVRVDEEIGIGAHFIGAEPAGEI